MLGACRVRAGKAGLQRSDPAPPRLRRPPYQVFLSVHVRGGRLRGAGLRNLEPPGRPGLSLGSLGRGRPPSPPSAQSLKWGRLDATLCVYLNYVVIYYIILSINYLNFVVTRWTLGPGAAPACRCRRRTHARLEPAFNSALSSVLPHTPLWPVPRSAERPAPPRVCSGQPQGRPGARGGGPPRAAVVRALPLRPSVAGPCPRARREPTQHRWVHTRDSAGGPRPHARLSWEPPSPGCGGAPRFPAALHKCDDPVLTALSRRRGQWSGPLLRAGGARGSVSPRSSPVTTERPAKGRRRAPGYMPISSQSLRLSWAGRQPAGGGPRGKEAPLEPPGPRAATGRSPNAVATQAAAAPSPRNHRADYSSQKAARRLRESSLRADYNSQKAARSERTSGR